MNVFATPPFTPATYFQAAAVGAAGIANIVKISKTKFNAGGSGGGDGGGVGSLSGGGGGGGTSATTPTFNPLDNQFLNNRPAQIQAFVLAGSAQTEEERRQKIEDLSRLN